MSNIQENLKKILSSVWGKDVRQAIHDSIHDCYEDGKAGAADLVARERLDAVEETKSDKAELTQEKYERAAEIAVERERINNIIALPEGSTKGDAELMDIRIGSDGTTYDSAGDAVREQVGGLKGDLINLIDSNLHQLDINWEKGAFDEKTGGKSTNLYRGRSSEKIQFKSNRAVFRVSEDYAIIMFEYDSSGAFLGYLGYSYGYGSYEMNVDPTHLYNVQIRNSASDKYENFNIFENVKIYEYAVKYIHPASADFEYRTQNDIFEAESKGLYPIYLNTYELGTLNSGIETSNSNRLRTVGFISLNFEKIKVINNTVVDGSQYIIFYDSEKNLAGGQVIPFGECEIDTSGYSYFRLLYGGTGYSTVLLCDDIEVYGVKAEKNLLDDFEVFKATDAITTDFKEEYETVLKKVLSNQTSTTFSFAFVTDLHFDYDKYDTQAPMLDNLFKCIRHFTDDANLSFVAFGGDNTNNNWTSEGSSLAVQKQSTRYVRAEMLKNLRIPLLIAIGNHDDNSIRSKSYNGETLSRANQENIGDLTIFDYELYNYYMKHCENTTFVFGERGKAYGYLDLNTQKVRVFILDSEDIPYDKNSNGAYTYTGQWSYAYRNTQLNFIANALKFTDKENPNEWSVLFIKHHSINPTYYTDGDAYNFDVLLGIINAYREGGTYSVSSDDADFGYNINIDYSGINGTVIADVAGHDHSDYMGVYQNIPFILTATAKYTEKENQLPTAFDIFTIDTEKRTIKITRFGRGDDRELSY